MASRKRKQSNKFHSEVNTQINSSVPFVFIASGIFIFFSLISFSESSIVGYKTNFFGRLGYIFAYGLFYLLGRGAYPLGLASIFFGIFMLLYKKKYSLNSIFITIVLFVLSTSIFFTIFDSDSIALKDGGGLIGLNVSYWLEFALGRTGKMILSIFIFFYSAYRVFMEIPENFSRFIKIIIQKLFRKKDSEERERQKFSPEETLKDRGKKINIFEFIPWLNKSDKNESSETKNELGDEIFHSDTIETNGYTTETNAYSVIEKVSNHLEDWQVKKDSGFYDGQFVDEAVFRFNNTNGSNGKSNQEEWENAVSMGNLTLNTETIEEDDPVSKIIDEPITTAEYLGLFVDDDESQESEKPTVLMKAVQEQMSQKTETEEKPKVEVGPDDFNYVTSIFGSSTDDYDVDIGLLKKSQLKRDNFHFEDESRIVAKQIEKIIKDFGLDSRVESFQKGPSVTMYELKIPSGIRVNKITTLEDELQLHLAAKSIRIIAPIPGKSAIGIEVPNKDRSEVLLGDIYKEYTIQKNSIELNIILGIDISGNVITTNLNKLPHLLIAGTTGSGKSVAVNSMIASLIFSKSPEEVRFIMIDPKMVEMALYKEIPHLLMEVITDPRKATRALAWAIQEMEARYTVVSELKCRELSGYNSKVQSKKSAKYKKMPYIVIFIDELSDLMMVAGKELEDYITRISQKARAVGIHLVMATQRPSVDVITGLIKANCPARMAFHVAQKMDSKIILDQSGADTLLGKGDMLYKSPTSSELTRIQAPYISEMEIEKIVGAARSIGKPNYVNVNLEEGIFQEESNGEDEAVFQEAWQIIKTERKASASYLQRRLRIGYNKAARIMELMEERGYVSAQVGSKPREILK